MDIVGTLQMRMRDQQQRRALEFRGRWFSWGDIARVSAQIEKLLQDDNVPLGQPIGVVVRNSFGHAATLLGLVAARRSIYMIHAYQPPESLAADVQHLGLTAIVAAERDWNPEVIAGAKRAGTLGIALSETDGDVARVSDLHATKVESANSQPDAEPALHVLTSGTTGKPKNVALPFSMLKRAVISAALGNDNADEPPPQVMSWPLSGNGGLCNLMACGVTGTPFTLLEKFSVEEFVAAIKRSKPTWFAVPPAALRVILAADVPPEDLASVKAIFGGSAALEADEQDAFEKRYDCMICWAYGASEFGGTVISWTPALRQEFGSSKRGSVGRVLKGLQIRAVDPETGKAVPTSTEGLLHALVPEISPDWIKTTDLVMIDSDGFVFHRGRNDGAIVRGGFKILPDAVVEVLRSHPLVGDAAVVGIADALLGAVPVAAIETKPGKDKPTAEDLERLIRKRLPATHVPVAWRIVDALPRTSSMKAMIGDVRKLFDQPP